MDVKFLANWLRELASDWRKDAKDAPMRAIGEAMEHCAGNLEDLADKIEGCDE